jgi:4-amino-4-deoxy-L-arabinose transferase-like glycosyltransferase
MHQTIAVRRPTKAMGWRGLVSHDRLSFAGVGAMALAFFLVALSGLGVPANVDDEAHLADAAFQFADHGQIASPLLAALLPGAGEHLYWQPPLYTVLAGAWTAVLGEGLFQLRLLSALAGAALVILVMVLARRVGGSRREALLAALFTLTSAWVFNAARMGRMDVLAATCILAALVAYGASARRGFARPWVIAAGWFSGFAVLLHPVGVVAGIALTIALLVEHRPHALKPMLFPVAICLAAWIGYALLDWQSFQNQMNLQLSRKEGHSFSQPFLTNQAHLPMLAVGAGALVALALRGWRRDALARALVITGVVAFAAAVYGRESYYFLYFIPLFAACLPALIRWGAARGLAWIVVGVVLLICVGEGFNSVQQVTSGPSRGEFESDIRRAVPAGEWVFIGPEAGRVYFALRGRNEMSSYLPLPVEPEAQAMEARRHEYLIANEDVMADWAPELHETVQGEREVARVSAGAAGVLTVWKR